MTENRITKLFGIQYPIIQGGMVWCSGWRLAAAVSNAGGLGLLGAGSMHPETLVEHIHKLKAATNKPWGVNVPLMYPEIDRLMQILVDEQVRIVFTSAGSPKKYTAFLHEAGITVVHVVPSSKLAIKCEQAGVDAIDIADCPVAKARIDSSILACKVMRELGLTAIPHMTCRDRNINATKALLLGLNVEGVNNVLTVTGDPVPAAERGLVKTMFSYNSAVLANHIRTLNEQIFQNNPFMISGALNVNAVNFDSQIIHAKRKISQGIDVLFTQPVLTERALNNLKRAREELDVKILGGIMPVVSYRNACFMNSEMAGIDVDPRIIEMYQDKDRAQGEELAEQISAQVAQEIAPYVDGFYLITPFKRVELILRIIKQIRGLLDR